MYSIHGCLAVFHSDDCSSGAVINAASDVKGSGVNCHVGFRFHWQGNRAPDSILEVLMSYIL